MKRIICVVITLLLITTTLPSFAAEERTSGLFTYQVKKNGTAIITDFDWISNDGQDVIIPPLIDGYSVVEIADHAFDCESYEEAMNSMVLITLPETLISIGDFAFMESSINSINIPNSLQSIGVGVFRSGNKRNLQFRIDPKHPYFAVIDNTLYDKQSKELIASHYEEYLEVPEGIVSVRAYAFDTGLGGEIFLPSTLRNVGDYAFCEVMAFIEINGPLEKVGVHAFEGEAPQEVAFVGEGCITEVPDYAFYKVDFIDCSMAENEEFVRDIVTLGDYSGCGQLYTSPECFNPLITTIPTELDPKVNELPETVKVIKSRAFTSIVTDFKLPKSLTEIADDAFPLASTFIVESGSYAQRWADENGFTYTVEGADNLDWLNN